MRVKALRGFCLGGGTDVDPGQIFEIAEEWNARRLIGMGYVVPAEADPAPPPVSGRGPATPAEDQIVVREPEPEHREPRTRRKE